MERPCTSKLFPFWRGTLPPHEGADQRPAASRPIQSSKISHCHGSSFVPPTLNRFAASIPSLVRYGGAILSDGSWLPTSLPCCEDLADLVATALNSFCFFYFPDGFPILLSECRQCPCVITRIYICGQYSCQCPELFQPIPSGGYALHFHSQPPFEKFPVCKSALDGEESPAWLRGGTLPTSHHSPSLITGPLLILILPFVNASVLLLFCALQK